MKVVAVIPAHLASVRFPGKILFEFHGLPMIEHVRRRALMSRSIDEVYVATCDTEIAEKIQAYGGQVIMTANTHTNGTSRVAEAAEHIDCTHIVLLQGDEPLLLPSHLDAILMAMRDNPEGDAWNATGPIEHEDELDRHSFVKCAINERNRILYCFRRSPCYCEFETQKHFVRKILGIIAYRKEFIRKLAKMDASPIEKAEFIEQMRIIENTYELVSVPVDPSLPSVNEPKEAEIILEYIENNPQQQELLNRVLSFGE